MNADKFLLNNIQRGASGAYDLGLGLKNKQLKSK